MKHLEPAEVVGFDGVARTVTLRFEDMPCAAIGDRWVAGNFRAALGSDESPTAEFAEAEPETCLAEALYLLQLIQQDLNLGRKITVWPRVKRARAACQAIEARFTPHLRCSVHADHHPDCDVNDRNPDGILKPCNCGLQKP